MKHFWRNARFCWWALCVGPTLLLDACSHSSTEQAPASTGQLQLALTGNSTHGIEYRLRNGVFNITGAFTIDGATDDKPEAELMRSELKPGDCAVAVNPGWVLERVVADDSSETVRAELTSANAQLLTIEEQTTTSVCFRFRVGDDALEFGYGGFRLGIEVDGAAASGGSMAGAGGVGGSGFVAGTGGSATDGDFNAGSAGSAGCGDTETDSNHCGACGALGVAAQAT
ncbi:hypothetical protein ACFL5O_11325 [Myxococcota bacterium]